MQSTNSNKQIWALIDCNNFYASCEKLFRPDLWGKPVVVLSNNDGCIIARSREAKALGIPMGEPAFKLKLLLEKHGVTIFSANFALYGDISSRIMNILESLCPKCEQYSIDEAFLQLDGAILPNLGGFCADLRKTIQQWTGITVSVGVGMTPTLAKLANHIAKKNPQFHGLYSLARKSTEIDSWLARIPVAEIWGMGKGHCKKLQANGISTALAMKNADDVWLKKNLTITGFCTALELRGITCQTTWENPDWKRKTILHSRSFGNRIHGFEELSEAVSTFTARCAERMRAMRLVAGGIWVRIRTSNFDSGYYANSGSASFLASTDDTAILIKKAKHILQNIYASGYPYAKAAVMFFDLAEKDKRQLSMFETTTEKSDNLMAALDRINQRYGKLTLRFGAMGLHVADWNMKQKRRSPGYTSDWNELAMVRWSCTPGKAGGLNCEPLKAA